MPTTRSTGFFSPASKRARALKVIDKAKARGRTETKAVAAALETLNQLDPVPYIHDLAFSSKVIEHDAPFHLQAKHTNVSGAAYTIGGQIVPISQPVSAEEHDSNLGWTEPGETTENPFAEASDTLQTIVNWIAESATLQTIGLRALALCVVTNPASFSGRCSGSLSDVAKLFGIKSRQHLQRHTAEIKSLTQDKRWNARGQRYLGREKNKACALAYHKRVGHKIHATS